MTELAPKRGDADKGRGLGVWTIRGTKRSPSAHQKPQGPAPELELIWKFGVTASTCDQANRFQNRDAHNYELWLQPVGSFGAGAVWPYDSILT